MKRAVILFAEGYETVEALLVVDLLQPWRCGSDRWLQLQKMNL